MNHRNSVLTISGSIVFIFILAFGIAAGPKILCQISIPFPLSILVSVTGLQHCTPQTILSFKGSNTIGGKLLPALAKTFLQQEGYADIHEVPGYLTKEEIFIVGRRNDHDEQIEIQAQGTKTAFEGLISGSCDIGMASRKVKPEDLKISLSTEEQQKTKPDYDRVFHEKQQNLKKLGDLASETSEHVIAMDGIALIVHPSNPINTLSIEQIADIFCGSLNDWSQLGGQPGTIDVYARDDKSGTYDFFKKAVLSKAHCKSNAKGEKELAARAQRFADSKELSAAVSHDPVGIGFIGFNYIFSNKVIAISDVGVAARKPSLLTIKTEDYLLSRRLYLYIAENNTNPVVSKFIEFAVGADGQRVVESAGLVSLDVTPPPSDHLGEIDSSDPRMQSPRWRSLTDAAAEIPTHLRFHPNSNELDNRAKLDIGRIIEKMSQPDYRGRKLVLIGFADSRGTRKDNLALSQSRADRVKYLLTVNGATVLNAEGIGAEAFVAPNDTDENREKNRRVEVWLK